VSDNTRPVAPICYLTLGDLYNNAPGFFSSVNLAIPEGSTWTLTDGTQVPHICTLAFEFTYIGKQNPTMTSGHYDNISKTFPSGNPNAPPPPPPRPEVRLPSEDDDTADDIAIPEIEDEFNTESIEVTDPKNTNSPTYNVISLDEMNKKVAGRNVRFRQRNR
jgi:hypothetical protein